jgi:hypothetical protein
VKTHHLVISGTGRTGTTFLVQLFTELGLDTGFADSSAGIFEICNAGMEWDLRSPDVPYVVKDPRLCDYLDDLLQENRIVIDHAFVPVRDLYSAAESRRHVTQRADPALGRFGIPGGLWDTNAPEQQEDVLARYFHQLIQTLTKNDIPLTLLSFPRIVLDPDYLYQKVSPVVAVVGFDLFLEAFSRVARPELVHDFRERTPGGS